MGYWGQSWGLRIRVCNGVCNWSGHTGARRGTARHNLARVAAGDGSCVSRFVTRGTRDRDRLRLPGTTWHSVARPGRAGEQRSEPMGPATVPRDPAGSTCAARASGRDVAGPEPAADGRGVRATRPRVRGSRPGGRTDGLGATWANVGADGGRCPGLCQPLSSRARERPWRSTPRTSSAPGTSRAARGTGRPRQVRRTSPSSAGCRSGAGPAGSPSGAP